MFVGGSVMRLSFVVVALLASRFAPAATASADSQLVMFATPSCTYCSVFDREIGRDYTWSRVAREAPLHRVDLERHGTGGYALKSDIEVMPTFVMFRRGQEVGRIAGYPGKENFYLMVDHLLAAERQ
jgi:thioredoxin-related protein